MATLRLVVALLVFFVLGGGCGVDDGDVGALATLPGVEDARSSCTLGQCILDVTAAGGVTAEQLGDVMREAREIDASKTEIRIDRATIAFVQDYDGSTDDGGVALALSVRLRPQIMMLQIDLRATGLRVDAQVEGSRDQLWETTRAVWDDLDVMPEPLLTATSDDGNGDHSRLSASGSYPDVSVAFVRGLASANLLTGVVIDDDRVRLGTSSPDLATRIEGDVKDDSRASGLAVDVVLAANVLAYRDDLGGDQQQVRAMVTALESVKGAGARVDGSTVEVNVDVASLDEMVSAITAVRRDQPDVGSAVPITVEFGISDTIELRTTGDPDLLTLAGLLRGLPDVNELKIRTPDARRDRPKPPADTGASVQVEIASNDLVDAVGAVAARFARWGAPVRSVSVFVTAVDPEGRQPSVALRVDRRGSTWVPSSLDRGTPEQTNQGIRAWRSGGQP